MTALSGDKALVWSTLSARWARRPHGTIAVLGSANVDLVTRQERLPKPGETVLGRTSDRMPGGKGLNQAIAAARVGGRVAFMGRVGADEDGQRLVDLLQAEHVDTGRLVADTDRRTGVAQVSVLDGGENAIVVLPGANASAEWSPADEALVATAAVVVAQLERPTSLVRRAFELARAHGVLTVLTPAPVNAEARDLLPLVDVLLLNEHEAHALTGQQDAIAAVESLSTGSRLVVMTRGRQSSLVAHDGTLLHEEPVRPTTALDTTGAGDCFAGTLVARLAAGDGPAAALRAATIAASLSVSRHGAASAMPMWFEVVAASGAGSQATG